MRMVHQFWRCVAILLLVQIISETKSELCMGSSNFEKNSRFVLHGVQGRLLTYGGSSSIADCLMRCQNNESCAGVEWNYKENSCTAVDRGSNDKGVTLQPIKNPINFFEKICVNVKECSKDWVFERVVGFELEGLDNRIVEGIKTRIACAEMCLRDTKMPCRSVEYNLRTGQCRLSKHDRRSQPLHFRPASKDIHYVENQCSQVTNRPHCEYEEFKNQDLMQAERMMAPISKMKCKEACEKETTFTCRSFTWTKLANECHLSSDDLLSTGPSAVVEAPGTDFYQRSPCLDLQLECSVDSMIVNLKTDEPFQGRVFSQNFPTSCQMRGKGTKETSLSIKFSDPKCGVVDEGSGIYSNVIVVQHHPVIQRRGDKAIKLVCLFEAANQTVGSGFNINFSIGGAVATAIVNATAPSPKIRLRIVDKNGDDISGAKLGDELYLRLDLDETSIYGILARNLVARNGDNSDSIALLDERGCPVDAQIFPSLQTVPGTKSLQGKFEAFKFSEDAVVRFTLNVQFCLEACQPADCGSVKSFGRKRRSVNSESLENIPSEQTFDDDDDVIYHDMPLQKEIIVASSHVSQLSDEDVRKEDMYKLGQLVCTPKEVLVAIVIAAVVIQIFLILVAIMCVFIRRRHAKLTNDQASTITLTIPTRSSRPPPSVDESASTFKTLRNAMRD